MFAGVVSLRRADLSVRADDASTLRKSRRGATRRCRRNARGRLGLGRVDGSVFTESLSAFRESLSACRECLSVFAEVLSESVDGRLGIRGRPPRTRTGPVARARGTLVVPSGPLGAARVPVGLWRERLPMTRGRLGTRRGSLGVPRAPLRRSRSSLRMPRRSLATCGASSRCTERSASNAERSSWIERDALSPRREALCQDRAVLQPEAAVRSPLRDALSAFRDDRSVVLEGVSLFAVALEGIRHGSSAHLRARSRMGMRATIPSTYAARRGAVTGSWRNGSPYRSGSSGGRRIGTRRAIPRVCRRRSRHEAPARWPMSDSRNPVQGST